MKTMSIFRNCILFGTKENKMNISKQLFFRKAINVVISLTPPNSENPIENILKDLEFQLDNWNIVFRRGNPLEMYWKGVKETDPRIVRVNIDWRQYKKGSPEQRRQIVENAVIPKIQGMELPVIEWV